MNITVRHILLIATFSVNLDFGVPLSKAEEPVKRLNAFPAVIPDSTAIVFKKDDTIGVAIISNMRNTPNEGCDVQWFLRTDGALDFSPAALGLTTGTIKHTKRIKFGPFDTEWSVAGPGRGYVYFDDAYYTGVVVQPDLTNLSKVIRESILVRNLTGARIDFWPKHAAK